MNNDRALDEQAPMPSSKWMRGERASARDKPDFVCVKERGVRWM